MGRSSGSYPKEMRERAVRLVQEVRDDGHGKLPTGGHESAR